MIHSRPGFAPRRIDAAVAKLNADMVPALHRKAAPETTTLVAGAAPSNIAEDLLEARTRAAMAKLAAQHPPVEVIVNPTPSPEPQVLEPGK